MTSGGGAVFCEVGQRSVRRIPLTWEEGEVTALL